MELCWCTKSSHHLPCPQLAVVPPWALHHHSHNNNNNYYHHNNNNNTNEQRAEEEEEEEEGNDEQVVLEASPEAIAFFRKSKAKREQSETLSCNPCYYCIDLLTRRSPCREEAGNGATNEGEGAR